MEKLFEKLNEQLDNGGFIKAVLSGAFDKTVKKTVYEPVSVSKETLYRRDTFDTDGKDIRKNLRRDEFIEDVMKLCTGYRQMNIICVSFSAEVLRSKKGAVHISYGKGAGAPAAPSDNDRKKNYILDPTEKYDFLVMLGIEDKDGRIKDKKQSKWRQINRFLQIVGDVTPKLPNDGAVIWDLCCGKCYLSFAVYYYYTAILHKNVTLYCVDRKRDVIEECASYAGALGFNGMKFICGDVFKCLPERDPDMVLSLHACDVATDIVLSEAVKRNAKVILSSPCCQHELAGQLDCPDLQFITKEPILKQKLCAIITDALRCKLLHASGYAVTTLEFIDPDETPKNLLIRAEKTAIPEKIRQKERREYDELCERLNADPMMRKLLS
ncbi:MAG: SAM-dependent methyltransferase [Clostridia bacterium]|nr:SAM-dependent methyltransferase [Clostridia bacterium]